MQPYLVALFAFLCSSGYVTAQTDKALISIRVDCIETRLVADTTLTPVPASSIEHLKVKVVHFTLLERKGRVKRRPKYFIVIPVITSDHECDFQFVEGATYTLPAVVAKLPYAGVKMFNEWHYRLDCYQLPIRKL